MALVGLLLFLTFSLYMPSIHIHARLTSVRRSVPLRRDTVTDTGTVSNSTMASASWIWAANSNGAASTAPGNVAFIRNFTTPSGQSASSALIAMTAVDSFYLWVNGQPIGYSSTGQNAWKSAQVLSAALNDTTNVFSVLVTNAANSGAPSPGFLAAIQITYSGGSNDNLIVSDANWLASTDIPSDFPTPADLSQFAPAAVAAPYGFGSWGHNVTVPSPDPNPLNLTDSNWIWSTADAEAVAPAGNVGFQRTVSTPTGKSAVSATILLTVDNGFALYLNGDYVGAPPLHVSIWQYAQQFTVNLNPTVNVIAVVGQNFNVSATTESSAGLIAAIRVSYADGSSDFIPTNSSWLYSPDSNFNLSTFLSTSNGLSPAFSLGPYGMQPWGNLTGTSNVLAASNVPSAPFGGPSASASVVSSADPSHSVPAGAIAGAVVGVLVVVTAIIILLLWRRRRRNSIGKVEASSAFSPIIPAAEFATTVPTVFPTPATYGGSAPDYSIPPSSLPPMPTPTAPRSKADIAAMMQASRSADEYAEAPPSYAELDSVVDESSVMGESSRL
ncbi:hypothetical protein DFH07DRAFT_352252 [Mycena maculata]|uniref:Uncharacterized protein n=1 Tax=Mycena maculata TaxID=230809 RepID=A0AAD7JNT9_9AGAR|nr:hypothetical protein DFH07DRAFT_352252 [Mycena maculata]